MSRDVKARDLKAESLGLTIVMLATFMTGMQSVAVKVGYWLDLPILVTLVMRKVIFIPLYAAWMFAQFKPAFVFARHHWVYILFAMGLGMLGNYVLPLLSMLALKKASAGVVTVIIFTYPLFVILFNSVLMRVRPPAIHIATFFMIQVGIYLLLGGGTQHMGANTEGALYALAVSVLFAVFNILMKVCARKLGTRRYVFHALNGALIASFVHFIFVLPFSALAVDFEQFFYLLVFSIMCFVPMFMLAEGVQRIGVSRTSLINSLSPFLTMVWAYFVLGEVLTHQQIAGGIVVVLSILVLEKDLLRLFIPRYKKRATPITTPD